MPVIFQLLWHVSTHVHTYVCICVKFVIMWSNLTVRIFLLLGESGAHFPFGADDRIANIIHEVGKSKGDDPVVSVGLNLPSAQVCTKATKSSIFIQF